MATELREYLNNIVEEKNAKVIPTNIRKGITLYGVEGTLEEGIDTTDATAVASTILQGETAYVNDEKIEGTMANNAELTYSPSDEEQAIPEGYTSGGRVEATDITRLNEYQACLALANSIENLEDYSDTTATAEDIREGKTAYSNGEKIEGTLVVNDNNSKMNTAFSSGMNGSYKYSQIYQLVRTIPDNATINAYTTSAVNMFYGCSALRDIPVLNASHIKDMQNMFYGCSYLTDESLNNILLMCANATSYTATKTLKYLGLGESQSNKCKALINYQAFLDAGWTTGY